MTQRVLIRLGRLNPTGVFLGVGALVFVALVLPGIIGGAMLIALAAGIGWVLAQTWTVHPARARGARLVILALLAGLAVVKIMS
jgi:hypothetical protein